MIDISHVSKSFDGVKILNDVSIHIAPGTIYGLIGENGVGKSTLIQCLVGIYKADEGEIKVDDQLIYENDEVKQKIAYVADRNIFFKNYTIAQMIEVFRLAYPTFSIERFNKYNEVFKLKLKTKVKNLSKGMQMRLSLMLNLAVMPKVLVLDEPTSGLDPLAKKQVLDFVIEQVDETKMTVVISSHHLSELEMVCDEITMLSKGKVAYQSSVEELKEKVRKLQVVFKGEAPAHMKQWNGVMDVSNIGSVYYIVTKDYSEALEQKLRENGATLVETIGLNLEEIFVYTALADKIKDEEGNGNETIKGAY